MNTGQEPLPDCNLCPRLYDFRMANRDAFPDWFNAPVPSFGAPNPALLIVGLAPGLRGANRTGRPFTGDYAGDLLYPTLIRFGFAHGQYQACPDDGLALRGAMITNAVRCVPPQNKPAPLETKTCGRFLNIQIDELQSVRAILALGRVAHDSILTILKIRKASHPFGHQARHNLAVSHGRNIALFDSYHCSRYNTNTGRLTTEMFEAVFRDIRAFIDAG